MSIYYRIRNKLFNIFRSSFLGRLLLLFIKRPVGGEIIIVSATRFDEKDFWIKSALGQSLEKYRHSNQIKFDLYFNNKKGLPAIYNIAIKKSNYGNLIIFVHDDVWIEDENWIEETRKSLGAFDIVGLAGNRRLSSEQPAWIFKAMTDKGFIHDTDYLSGTVYMGKNPLNKKQHFYGKSPAECKVLDGLFLCAKARTLKLSKTFFDEQFDFDFYDMDFCRTAVTKGLILGTWNINVVHQSAGSFGGPSWRNGYIKYLNKWNYV